MTNKKKQAVEAYRTEAARQGAAATRRVILENRLKRLNLVNSRVGWILLKLNPVDLTPGKLFAFSGQENEELIPVKSGEFPNQPSGKITTVKSEGMDIVMYLGEEHFPDKETNKEPSFVFLHKQKKYILTENSAENLWEYNE